MMSKKGDLHIKWCQAYKSAHSELSGVVAQQKANEIWIQMKTENKTYESLEKAVAEKIKGCEATKFRKQSAYSKFFVKVNHLIKSKISRYYYYVSIRQLQRKTLGRVQASIQFPLILVQHRRIRMLQHLRLTSHPSRSNLIHNQPSL